MKKVILIGFATSGKSSVGKLLAKKLGAKFVDTDAEIERDCDMTIRQIFDAHGEAYFRQKENDLLLTLAPLQDVVIACGGGSVAAESFAQLAKGSVVIWLTATASTVKSRLGGVQRPLFDGLGERELQQFIDVRTPLYERYAEIAVPTDNLSVEQVAENAYLKLKS